jgi:hypothetical protein
MGILDKIRKREEQAPPQDQVLDTHECPHTALAPHWESLGDMGKPELATYNCEACGQRFGYEDAQLLLEKPPDVLASAPPATQ